MLHGGMCSLLVCTCMLHGSLRLLRVGTAMLRMICA